MACTVEREPTGRMKQLRFSCDAEGCDVSPDEHEIMAAGGLKAMGWDCPSGKHFCPKHTTQGRTT